MHLRGLLGGKNVEGIIEKMVKELLPEMELKVVFKLGCLLSQCVCPQCVRRSVSFNSIIGRSEDGDCGCTFQSLRITIPVPVDRVDETNALND